MKDDYMIEAHSTHVRDDKCLEFWYVNVKERATWNNIGEDGILHWILMKYNCKFWIKFKWCRTETRGGKITKFADIAGNFLTDSWTTFVYLCTCHIFLKLLYTYLFSTYHLTKISLPKYLPTTFHLPTYVLI
jgi:hypothetical protein